MGFLVFLKKSRFFMQSRFRLDFGAQKLEKPRCCSLVFDPFFGSFLLVISSIMHNFRGNYLSYDPNSSLSWIGLANWIPFFWCYWGFKSLLNNSEKRKKTSLILLSGTLPVVITGLGQSFFNWDGPFEIFNGLIVWYQRPLDGITGLTGLFNNPNYAGSWLNVIWPFSIAALLDKKKYLAKNISVYLFTLGISLSTILTNSRSAWICFIIGTLRKIFFKDCGIIFVGRGVSFFAFHLIDL